MNAFLADVISGIHLATVAFMIGGLLLVIVGWPLRWRWVRNPWFRLSHLAIMGYIVFNAMRGELCFLTVWENQLREAAGQRGLEDISFIGRMLRGVLFVNVPEETLNQVYLIFGGLVAVSILCVRPRLRRQPA